MASFGGLIDVRDPRSAPAARSTSGRREAGVLALAALVYFGVRVIVEGRAPESIRNAERLLEIEQRLGVDIEASVQQIALDHDSIRVIGNLSYVWLHWPLLLAVLWILFRRDQQRYRQLRNAMFVSGATGLVLFAALPMAPPRFMPGFVGTVSDAARRHYLDYPLSWANKFAAFPSFHIGWTLIACLALATTLTRQNMRRVVLAPAALVAVAVVTTGNHYVLDSVSGAAIALAAYSYFGRVANRQYDLRPLNGDRIDVPSGHESHAALRAPVAND